MQLGFRQRACTADLRNQGQTSFWKVRTGKWGRRRVCAKAEKGPFKSNAFITSTTDAQHGAACGET